MVKNTSVIDINGNKYDAVTGQLVGAVKRVANQVKPAGGVIDGFVRRPARKVQNLSRQPQKSATLARASVAKNAELRKPDISSVPKARSPLPRPTQVLRAKLTNKNQHVSRFGKPSNSKAISGQVLPGGSGGTVAARNTQAMPSLVANISQHRLERLLDEALFRADSHRDMLRKQLAGNSPWARFKLMPKWLSIGVSALVVLLLGGFFAWQNVPQVSMRVASSKTHVSAAVPAYTPTGFKFAAPVSSTAKAVTIKYQDASAQKFTISQQSSNWDSSTLASNLGNTTAQEQVNGTTVYFHGSDNNASWVSHGVLNTLNNQAGLTSDQIGKIVDSMQ